MAFPSNMLIEARVILDDTGATPVYSDARLTQLLLVSALQVNQEISFTPSYAVDLVGSSITPDPELNDDFSTLTCLKAIVLLSRSKLFSGGGGIILKDKVSLADTTRQAQNLQLIAKAALDAYEKCRLQFVLGKSADNIAAILSPFRLWQNGNFGGPGFGGEGTGHRGGYSW